ncbi:hypothetical protein M427DRAFT_71363 [Gonapodya prolifera JEL478]|uniref:Inner membrane component domain-containing protein n=1 Tax=Gonapodya prolifera (strain JEL478) TaxID=1344416 RepID=A0A139A9N5_GONPJ|nr:hypothetical protein M427DRAFT_71363 [Gonapodya prolifera JEL478]|eukprot:KXS13379.1 hypothetical protein M427DRAFT_71363 [Gonapodya prolifera JEL478]
MTSKPLLPNDSLAVPSISRSNGSVKSSNILASYEKYAARRREETSVGGFWTWTRYYVEYLLALQQQDAWRTLSTVVWIVTGGWIVFLAYILGTLALAATLVCLPYTLQAARFATFALMPIGYEIKVNETPATFVQNFSHPYTVVANVVWFLLAGWLIILIHLTLGLAHALTIIGLGTAVLHFRMAWFGAFPFGRSPHSIPPPHLPSRPSSGSTAKYGMRSGKVYPAQGRYGMKPGSLPKREETAYYFGRGL